MYCQSAGKFSINMSLFKGTASSKLNDTNLKDVKARSTTRPL